MDQLYLQEACGDDREFPGTHPRLQYQKLNFHNPQLHMHTEIGYALA